MKKLISVLIILLFCSQVTLAETSGDNSYSTVDAPYLNLEANSQEDGSIKLEWENSSFDNFNGWKISRSQENNNPYYPEDGYIFFDQTPETDSYIDIDAPSGINYYRLCAITTDKVRYCSDVAEINASGSFSEYQDVVEDTELNLEVILNDEDDTVELSWNNKTYNNFIYWKILRSKNNSSLTYPEDGYLYYSNFIETDSMTDKNPLPGTVYYRVCAITSNKARYCSNVVEFDYESDVMCTMEYNPVCGEDGKTYSNECVATEQNGVEVDYEGECEKEDTCAIAAEDCIGLTLTSELTNENKIKLSWEALDEENLKYYKVVRSEKDESPTYPEDGYIKVVNPSNAENYSYSDEPLSSGTYYYAITAVYDNDSEEYIYSNTESIIYTASPAFNDTKDHSYEEAIKYVKKEGIVSGYDNGTYKPDNTINRAELSKIIVEALYDDVETTGLCFLDVREDWYATYVCKLKNLEVVGGYPDGNFKPAQEVNAVEALKIILLAFDAELPEAEGEWYAPYWEYALENNLLPSSITSADKKLTRGEMAEIIYRLKNK